MFDIGITDISGLQQALSYWELADYFATGVVFVGVLGELLAEFTNLFATKDNKGREKRVTLIFTVVLLLGLGGELAAMIRTSQLTSEMTKILRNDIVSAYKSAGDAAVEAGRANERAAKANERAEQLAKENTTLRGDFEKATAQARLKQEELRRQNLATEAELSEAEAKVEGERKTRLELEQSLAPRVLGFQIGPGAKTTFDELKPFAGTNVAFVILTEAEARRAAQEIQNVLMFAGWKATSVDYSADIFPGFYDGVIVQDPGLLGGVVFSPTEKDGTKKIAELERTRKCATALVSYLLSKGWKARMQNLPDFPALPSDTIRIVVGFKPNPFYDPDWVKEMEERYRRIMQEMKERDRPISKPPSP